MASFSSVIQGVLFATINMSLMAYVIKDTIHEKMGIPLDLAPRILLMHFLLTFILGMVLSRATVDMADSTNNLPLVVSALVVVYVTNITIMVTDEPALFVFPALFVLYVYTSVSYFIGRQVRALFAALLVAVTYFVVTNTMVSDHALIDEIASFVSSIYDIDESQKGTSYLTSKGSIFSNRFFPLGVALFSFGYTYV
jgi:hypothetical protein